MKTNIRELIQNGTSLAVVEATLIVNDGMTPKQAKLALKDYRGKTQRNDMQAIVEHIIANKDKMTRRNLAIDCQAEGLCKESTAFHYLSLMNFCDEYHKQMSEV